MWMAVEIQVQWNGWEEVVKSNDLQRDGFGYGHWCLPCWMLDRLLGDNTHQ